NDACREDDIVELANGFICCTVADDFLPTMTKLLDRSDPPDHIIIETSGLALPQPLIKAFLWPGIRERVSIDGVITVVDAPALSEGRFAADTAAVEAQRAADEALDHESPLSELFGDQLNAADMVLLNKADLVEEQKLADLLADLSDRVRNGVRVVVSQAESIDSAALLGMTAAAENDMANRLSHHEAEHGHEEHDHDDFETFIVETGAFQSREEAIRRIEDVMAAFGLLRLKGFAAVSGSPARLVIQAVGPRVNAYFDREWAANETPSSALVVIGESGLNQAAIRDTIAGESLAA
ncbi:MAG: cobalamin biosynthesis protein CobW, partial [Pseudomonadota bacterium]